MKKIDYIMDRYERLFEDYQNHIVFLESLLDKKYYGDLREEIAELSAPVCQGCNAVIDELRAENARLREELRGAKISAGKAKANKEKVKKTKKVKRKKQSLCVCKDCGTYFYAMRSDAKRCPECNKKHDREYKRLWAQNRAK